MVKVTDAPDADVEVSLSGNLKGFPFVSSTQNPHLPSRREKLLLSTSLASTAVVTSIASNNATASHHTLDPWCTFILRVFALRGVFSVALLRTSSCSAIDLEDEPYCFDVRMAVNWAREVSTEGRMTVAPDVDVMRREIGVTSCEIGEKIQYPQFVETIAV